MSRRRLAVLAVVAAIVLVGWGMRSQRQLPEAASEAPLTTGAKPTSQGAPVRVSALSPPHEVSPQAAAVRRQEESLSFAAARVISVAAEGESLAPPGAPSAQWDAARAAAKPVWQRAVARALARCGNGTNKEEVELEARLVPLPRREGESTQVMMAEWVTASPATFEALAKRHDLRELQLCLQAARGVAMQLPVPPAGAAPLGAPSPALEQVSVLL